MEIELHFRAIDAAGKLVRGIVPPAVPLSEVSDPADLVSVLREQLQMPQLVPTFRMGGMAVSNIATVMQTLTELADDAEAAALADEPRTMRLHAAMSQVGSRHWKVVIDLVLPQLSQQAAQNTAPQKGMSRASQPIGVCRKGFHRIMNVAVPIVEQPEIFQARSQHAPIISTGRQHRYMEYGAVNKQDPFWIKADGMAMNHATRLLKL